MRLQNFAIVRWTKSMPSNIIAPMTSFLALQRYFILFIFFFIQIREDWICRKCRMYWVLARRISENICMYIDSKWTKKNLSCMADSSAVQFHEEHIRNNVPLVHENIASMVMGSCSIISQDSSRVYAISSRNIGTRGVCEIPLQHLCSWSSWKAMENCVLTRVVIL